MQANSGNSIVELVRGDITEQDTDVIVNAANSQLILGSGVAGAIKTRGGPEIQKQCDGLGPIPVGGAVITTGGNLKARYVIHAVGPRMGQGNEDEKLEEAVINSLKIADRENLRSIALPAISTGVFGFPVRRCAEIMLHTIFDYLKGQTHLENVVVCLFTEADYRIFEDTLHKVIKNESNAPE